MRSCRSTARSEAVGSDIDPMGRSCTTTNENLRHEESQDYEAGENKSFATLSELHVLRHSYEKGSWLDVAVPVRSFAHAFSGGSTWLTTGKLRTGPAIQTFGGDELGRRVGIFILLGEP